MDPDALFALSLRPLRFRAVRAFTSVMRGCVAMREVTVRDPLLHEREVAAVSAALYVKVPCSCPALRYAAAFFSC